MKDFLDASLTLSIAQKTLAEIIKRHKARWSSISSRQREEQKQLEMKHREELEVVQQEHDEEREAPRIAETEALDICQKIGNSYPIEMWIPFMEEGEAPEIITVKEEGARIVFIKPTKIEGVAFMTWAQAKSSTRWKIKLKLRDGVASRSFALVCACCDIEVRGYEDLPEDSDELSALQYKLRREFREKVEAVAKAHSIHTIFIRQACRWTRRFGDIMGVSMMEGDGAFGFLDRWHTSSTSKEFLSFIANPTLT